MSILIVDDSLDSQILIYTLLKSAGYKDILRSASASEAYTLLGITNSTNQIPYIDLILMDIIMPDINGINACYTIKNHALYHDVPIIMVTAQTENNDLKAAFDAGANDYITKPINKIELLARVQSALKLKHEIDRRKTRELDFIELTRQLEEANKVLRKLTSLDGLTGIANRRHFDYFLDISWTRSISHMSPLSLIMYDLDNFKLFNDTYGHQSGDDCLKQTASAINKLFENTSALVARYGGEEFAVIMPDTDLKTAASWAEKIRITIENLNIPHSNSKVKPYVTVSLGVASIIPTKGTIPQDLISASDSTLYSAKRRGRNQVVIA